jgi:hypothetical protein
MKRAFLAAVLAATCGVACGEEDTNLYYKVFSLTWHQGKMSERERDLDLKEYLSREYKVSWPIGGDAILAAQDHQLIVRNTMSNLNSIAEKVASLLCDSRISVEYHVFAFRMSDIEQLLNGKGVSCESLMGLRNRGRAKLVTTATAVTKSGQECVAKNVQEILYPTALESGIQTNHAQSVWTIVPANFELREVGTILEVVSEFDMSGLISLMVNPQWATLDRWETFDGYAGENGSTKRVPFRQPVVNVSSIQTQVKVKSGETVLLGGGKAVDEDWVQYHFLKAEILSPKILK